MNKWTSISDFIIFSTKGITPRYVENSSVIVLNQKCIRNNRIDFSFAQFTDASNITSESKFVRKGDILINSTGTGTAGRCAFVSNIPDGYKLITDSHILLLRCSNYDEAKCLSYVLFSFEKTLMSFMTGSSGQSELDKTVLFDIKTKMPRNSILQKRISRILSDFESKIALNTKINVELENMAKTIYDYWFVQFDFPISKELAKSMGKPKLEGKPYRSSRGKMVWSDKLKREVPEGWVVHKIGELLYTSLGGTPSTKVPSYWEGGNINWLNSGEIANFPIIDSEVKVTQEAIKNSATELLPKGSVMLSITRHLRPSILAIDACANQSVVGIKEKGDLKCYFLYPYLQNEIPRLMSLRSGAQQPHINKEIVDESLILIPKESDKVLRQYNEKVGSIYELIINNAFQNRKLTELRDWILPNLMNGQVRVKDTEAMVEMGMVAEERSKYSKSVK